jgi:hypothetical protein
VEDGDEFPESIGHEYGTVLASEKGVRDTVIESQFDYGSRAVSSLPYYSDRKFWLWLRKRKNRPCGESCGSSKNTTISLSPGML